MEQSVESKNNKGDKKRSPKHKKKRSKNDDTSPVLQSEYNSEHERKRKERKEKKKKRKRSPSPSSSDSSSSSESESERKRRKLKRKLKKEAKKLKRKQKEMKTKEKEDIKNKKDNETSANIPIELMEKSRTMAPMTKEEWEKKQSVVKRVYDEQSGRHRLIKGDGEVIEEIVSRDRHLAINKQATMGDANYFQAHLSANMSKR